MSAWGTGSFDNEDAAAWVGRLATIKAEDLKGIVTRAAAAADYIEAPEASVVVAAAEVISAIKGAPAENLPRAVADWIGQAGDGLPAEISELAVQAVDNIRRNSELRDLWLEAEGLNEWTTVLQDLQTRLTR